MKTIFLVRNPKFLTAASFLIIAVTFFSFKKNIQPDPVISSPQAKEFIHFTLDGTDS